VDVVVELVVVVLVVVVELVVDGLMVLVVEVLVVVDVVEVELLELLVLGRVVLVDDPGIDVVLEDEPGPGLVVVVVVVVEVVVPGLGVLRRRGRPAGGLAAVVVVVSPKVPRVDSGVLAVDRTSFSRLVVDSAAAIAAASRGSHGRVASWVTSPSASICSASA
jgi:hypothetical protein